MTDSNRPSAVPQPSAADRPEDVFDGVNEADLERALAEAPKGATALAGATVALLVIGWVLIYLLVFVPRGTVG